MTDMRNWINLTESEIFEANLSRIDSWDLIARMVEIEKSGNFDTSPEINHIVAELERRGKPWEEMMPEGSNWRAGRVSADDDYED